MRQHESVEKSPVRLERLDRGRVPNIMVAAHAHKRNRRVNKGARASKVFDLRVSFARVTRHRELVRQVPACHVMT